MAGLDAILAEASELLRNGQGAAAIPRLLEAAAAEPSSFPVQTYLGMAYAQAHQFPEAIQAFQKATTLQPADASTYYNLGVAYQHSGQEEAAGRAYDRTLQLDPNHAKAAAALEHLRSHAAPAQPTPPPRQPITVAPIAPPPAVVPPPPPVMPRPGGPVAPRATPSRGRATEKTSGGARGFLVPAAIVLILAAAAGAYFFFAPSPKRLTQAYLLAESKKDYAQLAKLCTKDSQKEIENMKRTGSMVFGGSQKEEAPRFEIGKTSVEADTAQVMVKTSFKVPANPFMGSGGGNKTNVEWEAPVILLKEHGRWKVDLSKTNMEQGKAFFGTAVGKGMMDQMQNLLKGAFQNPGTR